MSVNLQNGSDMTPDLVKCMKIVNKLKFQCHKISSKQFSLLQGYIRGFSWKREFALIRRLYMCHIYFMNTQNFRDVFDIFLIGTGSIISLFHSILSKI